MQKLNRNMYEPNGRMYDEIIHSLLLTSLVFMPLAFGVVQPWSEEVLFVLAGSLSIVFILQRIFVAGKTYRWSWAYIPFLLFCLVVVLQLLPLPISVIQILSPNTYEVRQELLSDTTDIHQAKTMMTISMYHYETWRGLRMICVVFSFFVIVHNEYRDTVKIMHLLYTISIIGGAIALLAIVQAIMGNGRIYWFFDIPKGRALSGPFVNHSHYGQYMNLTIGAALAYMLTRIHELFSGESMTTARATDILFSQRARDIWLMAAIIILGTLSVFTSLTRGGMISFIIAGILTSVLLNLQNSVHGRGWIMVVLAVGSFVCVLYVGFDAVYERLASLGNIQAAEGGRWDMLKNVFAVWTAYPLLGTGLGTHAFVYPAYDYTLSGTLATHAENEYAQMAEETGIVGLLIIVVFMIMIVRAYLHAWRNPNMPIRTAALGLGFGLFAVSVHSLSDFGQHIPAIAVLSTIYCALMINIRRMDQATQVKTQNSKHGRRKRLIGFCVLGVIGLLWISIIWNAECARGAHNHWMKAQKIKKSLQDNDWQASNAVYKDLIQHTANAAQAQPGNILYSHWLNVFRWYAISRFDHPQAELTDISPEILFFAERIVQSFHQTRRLCPTFGPTYCVVGQIEKWILERPEGARHIRLSGRLAPGDPTVCLSVGLLEAHEDNLEHAKSFLERTVYLDGHYFHDVAAMCIYELARPDWALDLAGDSPVRLDILIRLLNEKDDNNEIVNLVKNKVRDIFEGMCLEGTAPACVYASLAYTYKQQEKQTDAIRHFRKALSLEYSNVDWRYDLATTLADTGEISDAINEAKICLRLHPEFPLAQDLIKNLSLQKNALD